MKSLREGRASLGQAFADVRDGEVWLVGAEIATYDQGNIANHEPMRDRKLLLHRGEIASLYGKVREKGLTLVPTRMYWKDGRAKVEIALARGKQTIDKRRDMQKRDAPAADRARAEVAALERPGEPSARPAACCV